MKSDDRHVALSWKPGAAAVQVEMCTGLWWVVCCHWENQDTFASCGPFKQCNCSSVRCTVVTVFPLHRGTESFREGLQLVVACVHNSLIFAVDRVSVASRIVIG